MHADAILRPINCTVPSFGPPLQQKQTEAVALSLTCHQHSAAYSYTQIPAGVSTTTAVPRQLLSGISHRHTGEMPKSSSNLFTLASIVLYCGPNSNWALQVRPRQVHNIAGRYP